MRFLQLSVVTYWRPKILILKNVYRFSLIDSFLDTSLTKLRDSNRYPLFRHRFTLRKVKLPAKERNNSQHCWANKVVSCCVRVGSGVQTNATPPINVRTCSASWEGYRPWDLNARAWPQQCWKSYALRIQHCWATLRRSQNKLKKFWELLAQKFYWRQTLRNNSQQHATTYNSVCKRTQHMTTKNVASVCKGLKRLYKHNGPNSSTTFDWRLYQPCRKHDRNCRV